jgi:hypothetical protein
VGTVKDERVKRGRRRVILFTVGVSAQRVYLDIRAPDGMQMCLSPQEIAQSQPPLTATAIRQAVTRATRTSFWAWTQSTSCPANRGLWGDHPVAGMEWPHHNAQLPGMLVSERR